MAYKLKEAEIKQAPLYKEEEEKKDIPIHLHSKRSSMLRKWARMILLPFLLHLHMAATSSADQDPNLQVAISAEIDGCWSNYCGDVQIPYPFGIGPNCYHDHFFDITCNTSSSSPTPFLTRLNLEVADLTSSYHDQQILVKYVPTKLCNSRNDTASSPLFSLTNGSSIDGVSSPYSLPGFVIDLVVSGGCDTGAAITDVNGSVVSGCALMCNESKVEGAICRSPVPFLDDLESYHVSLHNGKARAASREHGTICVQAGLAINSWNESNSSNPTPFPLQWTIKGLNKSHNVICKTKGKIEYCRCRHGSYGNPYHRNGCQVTRVCSGCTSCVVHINDHEIWNRYECSSSGSMTMRLFLVATALSYLGAWLIFGNLAHLVPQWVVLRSRKARNFRRNGGLLLQQMTSNEHGNVNKCMIFTKHSLLKATDCFNKERMLGDGGQGAVYKGMLEDGKTVAIKKAKRVDANGSQEFINEVVILSQANHRNIVRLLGCCLETEVPSLVYEYIPNGTLWDHIHNPQEDTRVTWQMRLQIAVEVAGALAYLHSSLSTPIFHRDIKSKNLLLDEQYRVKIADFGISGSVLIDQTHLTTNVVGTLGYLDPEYFRSHQFTSKSDVYSFGVVLLELLTSKKPIQETQSGKREGLAEQFLHLMECSKLDDILDPSIVEGNKGELLAVAKLAAQCLKMMGSDRPTMTEVVRTLEATQRHCSTSEMIQGIEGDASESRSYRHLPVSSFGMSTSTDVWTRNTF